MNENQWSYAVDFMFRVTELLEQIAKNTTEAKVEEPKSKITGFSAGDKK